jgi:hypothetical protein
MTKSARTEGGGGLVLERRPEYKNSTIDRWFPIFVDIKIAKKKAGFIFTQNE